MTILHQVSRRGVLAAFLLLVALAALCLSGCQSTPQEALRIVAGSESKEIEHIIKDVAEEHGFAVEMHYKGSVDMMLELQAEEFPYDAVLPANSMWIRLGDEGRRRVSGEASIMRSPVVFGLKRSKARELGWIDKDVTVDDILAAVRQDKLHFAITSATQSNSGASAYMGFLYALAGEPEMLELADLEKPELSEKIQDLLKGVERSSGSSGWLKDMFLQRYDKLDGMFNYESMIIAANRQLVSEGKEPLYAIYPTDGQAIADSTLGFVNKPGNKHKKEWFQMLRDGLLKPDPQKRIFETGFRTALIGMNPENVDKSVYNPDWGIDLERTISPIPWPAAPVIRKALALYQTSFRKPSFTVYLLDVSGSMKGQGLLELKEAMAGLLDQQRASRHMLQASNKDISIVIPFNDRFFEAEYVTGNDPEQMQELLGKVENLQAGGGTNIYLPVMRAMQIFQQQGDTLQKFLPSIILLTDGRSNSGSLNDVKKYWQKQNPPFELPPVFGVTFGKADEEQLEELAHYTVSRVFDGRKHGLTKAFRQAKGYN